MIKLHTPHVCYLKNNYMERMRNKIRKWFGVDTPIALGWDEWDEYYAKTKKEHPIVYFITWTIPVAYSRFKNSLPSPLSYISNRFVYQLHRYSGIKPGSYVEFDTKVESLFDEMVKFVDIECALHLCQLDKVAAERHGYKHKFFRFKPFVCGAAGIEYLEWCETLRWDESSGIEKTDPNYGQPTSQSKYGTELLDLYIWYTVHHKEREKRIEIILDLWHNEKDKPFKEALWKQLNDEKNVYEKETDERIVQLVKLRKSMWT